MRGSILAMMVAAPPLVLAEQVSPWSTYLTDTYRGDPRDVLYQTTPLDGAHALQLVRLAER